MSDKENLQPLEENEAAEKEEKNFEYDRTLCSLCQKKAREEGSYYCEDCRTKMMKTKIKGGSVVAAVLCVIVSLFALMLLGANATQMVGLLEADSLLNQGYVNAALGALMPLAERALRIDERDIQTGVDFQAERPRIDARIVCTIRIGQIVIIALAFGAGFLKQKMHAKQARAARAKTAPATQERKVSNG